MFFPHSFATVLALAFGAVHLSLAWETWDTVTLMDAPWADGDSFRVKAPDGEHVLRLYFVDAPETGGDAETDLRRIREQARYFGVEDGSKVTETGKAAAAYVRQRLAGGFSVYTVRAQAPGRSRLPRIYAMVRMSDGKDLGAELVARGLARVQGVRRALPDGTAAEDYGDHLRDLELAAAMGRKGIWAHADPDKLPEFREAQREDRRELKAAAFGVFNVVSAANPLNLNTASAEQLQQLRGIGPVLAERIIQARPFQSIDDLVRVPGIGPEILDRARPLVVLEDGSANSPGDELR